jgi:hypothetical protein
VVAVVPVGGVAAPGGATPPVAPPATGLGPLGPVGLIGPAAPSAALVPPVSAAAPVALGAGFTASAA